MSLKELASLAPWNWDPQAAKHPPKRAALKDFEKIESAWRHDDPGQVLAPAPTPRERRRPSAACNLTELGWETPSASGLARKAASADRARSLLKRKAAELQTPDSQKQPAPQQRSARSRTRECGQDPDAASNAGIPAAPEPSDMLRTLQEHGQQQPNVGPQVLEPTACHAGATDDSCAAAGASERATKINWVARYESTPSANQTPAQTHRDLSMQPPRWTPARLCGSAAQMESLPVADGPPLSPILHRGIAAADGCMFSCGVSVQLPSQGHTSALVQQLPAEKYNVQQGDKPAERSNGRATANPGQASRRCPTGSIPYSGGPQLAAEPAAAADCTPTTTGAGWAIAKADSCVTPLTGNWADGGGNASANADLSTHGPCSRGGDGRVGIRADARTPSAIVAAKNFEDLTVHTSNPVVHRRGDLHPWGDGRPIATALATRSKVEGCTSYDDCISERSLMSPATSQHQLTAHTLRSLPQLQLFSHSPGQLRLGDINRSGPRGQGQQLQQHLRPFDQPSLLCTGDSGSKAARLTAAGVEMASAGVAAHLPQASVAPTSQNCILLEDAIAKGTASTQPQPQKSTSHTGRGLTVQPPAWRTPLPGGTTQGDAHDIGSDAARSLSQIVALEERQGPAVTQIVGMHEVLQDTVAETPHEPVLPTAIAAMSSGKAVGKDSTGPGPRGTGAGAAPCRDQTSALPQSPLAARPGSHVVGFSPSTADIGEEAAGKPELRSGLGAAAGVWVLGQHGAAANRAGHTGFQAVNRPIAVAAARAKVPRIMTSSTTGISGSVNMSQGHVGSCEALDKGTLQILASSFEGSTAAPEALVPAATAVERSKPDSKVIGGVGSVTAMSGSSQNDAVLLSSVSHQFGEEQEKADADKGGDEGAPAEERPLKKLMITKADSNDTLAASTLQKKVTPLTMAMATEQRGPTPKHGTQDAPLTFRQPEQLPITAHCGITGASVPSPARCAGAVGLLTEQPDGEAATVTGCTVGVPAPSRSSSEPTLPPVALTQQQLMVLDQLLAFFRVNGCRHPSAMSAAELVAAISSFCQSAGIPVVASNIQTLASWLGTLLALEKPVKAFAQAQARARAQQQTQSFSPRSEPQLPQLQQNRTEQQQLVALARVVEPGDAVFSHGSRREGGDEGAGEAEDGQCPEGCMKLLGEVSSGMDQRDVTGVTSRTGSPPPQQQHLGPHGQPRCPPLGEEALQPQREQPLQQHRPGFEGTMRDGTAADAESYRAGSIGGDAGQDPLPILPLQPGRPLGPTPLEALSSEWSSYLSPAVTALYDRLASCQQALRSALMASASGPTLQPSHQGAMPYASQRQPSVGLTAALRAPAATPTAGVVTMASAACTGPTDLQPQLRAKQIIPCPQVAITQQLQRLLSRQHKHQQQVLGATTLQPGLTATGEGAAAESATAASVAVTAWPALAQPSLPGAGNFSWTQTQQTRLDHQALAAVPDSLVQHVTSSGGGGVDPSAATAGTMIVMAGQQKNPRLGVTAEPPTPAMQQAISSHNAVIAVAATGAPPRDCRPTQLHQMPTIALVTQPSGRSSSNAMPAMPIAGWSASSGQQRHWTTSLATASGAGPPGAAAAASAQPPMQPPARSQGQGAHASANPHATTTAATLSASNKWSVGGSNVTVAAAAAAVGVRLSQTPRVKYGTAVATTAQVPTQTAPQAAKAASSPYHAYDISGARSSLQFPPAAVSSTPGPYPRASGISPAEDASVLQPSPVQTAPVTGHTAAAVPYTHTLTPYGYPSVAKTGRAWHYAYPYGWYGGGGRPMPATEHAEPFAYPFTARGAAVPYARQVPGMAGGGSVQGSVSAALDFTAQAAAQGSIGPPGLEAVQQQEHLGFTKAKPASRRVKPVGLGWNMHGYAPTVVGQPYGHVSAGNYPAPLQGVSGWGGGS
ncbi:hypothetical protein Vretimale_3929 [Volvox reticuliferus]|uniref:Uncharacterized protein n=1 Tax=Volvox reticuliferus TaxID=1737510 RepID=A0A8J4D9W5_9CHLO|nr:hypothetical protein Vretifemale_1532 [Volvox reticuliferus]GIL98576.1 hypothetical protein Vretimale_3929 [Volvox reticuliferus]